MATRAYQPPIKHKKWKFLYYQDCTLQEQALRAAGCEVIRAEKVSATRREGRTELAALLEFLRYGDTLVVTRVDRLARSIKDLQDMDLAR